MHFSTRKSQNYEKKTQKKNHKNEGDHLLSEISNQTSFLVGDQPSVRLGAVPIGVDGLAESSNNKQAKLIEVSEFAIIPK